MRCAARRHAASGSLRSGALAFPRTSGASGCHDSAPHEGEGIMRKLYTVLAWTIAGAVVVQAAAIAFAFGGMLNLVSEGGVVDKALLESFQAAGVGEVGFMIHALVGGVLIPLIALALLVVSFFVRARGAKLWAAITFGLVVLQVVLGFSITDVPYLGLIHGANALAVVAAASVGAMRVGRRHPVKVTAPAEGATPDAVSA
jgi:amino acid transporter